MFKKIISLFLIVAFVMSFAGCSDKNTGGDLMSFSLTADPGNLDPQIATDYNAVLIIKNIYEGLLATAQDGKLTEGVAKDYDVSSDGLTYTFYLRDNAKWMYYDDDEDFYGAAVTAHDFVFAFQRLLNPETNSPYASDFYCIKNAQMINSGSMEVSALGVTATDTYTLVIELDYANARFLELLTNSAAMPCKQDFFENTKGKYGLDTNSILSNGPFYINQWMRDSYVRIRRNTVYSSGTPAVASGVNFTVRNSDEVFEALSHGTIDTGVLSYSEFTRLEQGEFEFAEFENIVWGIGFNLESEVFSNTDIRKAFAKTVDRDHLNDNLPDDAAPSGAIVPPAVYIIEQNYRELAGNEPAYTFNAEEARHYLEQGKAQLPEDSSLSGASIIIPEGYVEIFQYVSQKWQKELQVFLEIEELPQEDYDQRLASVNFDLAFISFSSDANTPDSIMSKFLSESDYNVLSYNSSQFDGILDSAIHATGLDQMVSAFMQAEQVLLQDTCFIPLFFRKEYFVTRTGISDVVFDSSSKIPYFKYASKK